MIGWSLNLDVEEKSTGELQFVGWLFEPRAVHRFKSTAQRNFMGKGQKFCRPASISHAIPRACRPGSREPYLFDKNILLGAKIYYRDYNSVSIYDRKRRAEQNLWPDVDRRRRPRLGFPVTEYVVFGTRYSLMPGQYFARQGLFYFDRTRSRIPMAQPGRARDPMAQNLTMQSRRGGPVIFATTWTRT